MSLSLLVGTTVLFLSLFEKTFNNSAFLHFTVLFSQEYAFLGVSEGRLNKCILRDFRKFNAFTRGLSAVHEMCRLNTRSADFIRGMSTLHEGCRLYTGFVDVTRLFSHFYEDY